MKLQIISIDKNLLTQAGFTLIEVLTTVAIIGMLFIAGSFMNFSSYRSGLINTEEATLVSIFEKARNQAMNNINHTEHGVHIDSDSYTIFEGPNYVSGNSTNEVISKNSKTNITPSINDIYFFQLSGEPSANSDIVLSNGINPDKVIHITKPSGLIDW